jgi:predicted aspartyl protease
MLVRAWVNGTGPFDFVFDTGAGATIISTAVARAAGVETRPGGPVTLGGMSGARPVAAERATIRHLALGDEDRDVPTRGLALVVGELPTGVDGILDPTEAFAPLGFAIHFGSREVRLFDPVSSPVRADEPPPDGAVVDWLRDASDLRPYVRLNGSRLALVDTGSGLGFALPEREAGRFGVEFSRDDRPTAMRDIAGGTTWVRRVRPITVELDGLTLGSVPTDVITGTGPDHPLLLGRDALRPFEVVFDPVNRLIAFVPR